MQFLHIEDRYVLYSNVVEMDVYVIQGMYMELDPKQSRQISVVKRQLHARRHWLRAQGKNKKRVCCGCGVSEKKQHLIRRVARDLQRQIAIVESLMAKIHQYMDEVRKLAGINRSKLQSEFAQEAFARVYVTFESSFLFLT